MLDKGDKRGKKKCVCLKYIQTHSYQNKEEVLITIIVLISGTGHLVVASIYSYFLLLLIPYFLCPQQNLWHIVALCLVR